MRLANPIEIGVPGAMKSEYPTCPARSLPAASIKKNRGLQPRPDRPA